MLVTFRGNPKTKENPFVMDTISTEHTRSRNMEATFRGKSYSRQLYGSVKVLLSHTHTRGLSVASMQTFFTAMYGGGGGSQKTQKSDYVIFEQPLSKKNMEFNSFVIFKLT